VERPFAAVIQPAARLDSGYFAIGWVFAYWKDKFRPDDAHRRIIEHRHERLKPAWLRLRVLIEKKQHVAPGARCARIAVPGEAQVGRVALDLRWRADDFSQI